MDTASVADLVVLLEGVRIGHMEGQIALQVADDTVVAAQIRRRGGGESFRAVTASELTALLDVVEASDAWALCEELRHDPRADVSWMVSGSTVLRRAVAPAWVTGGACLPSSYGDALSV